MRDEKIGSHSQTIFLTEPKVMEKLKDSDRKYGQGIEKEMDAGRWVREDWDAKKMKQEKKIESWSIGRQREQSE